MKYYIYISDAKIDMLWPQVPHGVKKKVAHEFKIDLKALSASRRVETEGEDNRIARLEAVVSFIEEFGNLGTVDEPSDFFRDTLQMTWGPYGLDLDSSTEVVYFGGQTEKTIVGLGGSARHVIGNTGSGSAHSHSATPMLLRYLAKQNASAMPLAEQGPPAKEGGERLALIGVELATTQMYGPKQNLEFIAKRLISGKLDDRPDLIPPERSKTILLGTPLYVAIADEVVSFF